MKSFYKKLTAAALLILTVCAAFLSSCSAAPSYEEFHTEENIAASSAVSDGKVIAYLFRNEDNAAFMDICRDSGKRMLRIELPEESEYYACLDYDYTLYNTVFQDINFDGEADLYVPCSVSTANLQGMVWLWDTKAKKFVFSEELSKLYELTVLKDEKIIKSTDYENLDGPLCTEYEWKNGKLSEIRSYTVTPGE